MATPKEYFEGLLKQAGVSDAKRQALISQLDDEEVSKALQSEVIAPRMRQEDYSRSMDALRTKEQNWQKWYADTLQYREQVKEEARQAALAELQGGNGNGGNGNGAPAFDAEAYKKMLLEETDKRFKTQESQFIGLMKTGLSLVGKHMAEFHEPLDVDALAKVAVEKGQTLDAAYNELVSPRRTAAQQAQFDAKLKEAREQGARDFASTHKIPIDTAPREHHPLLDKPTQGVVADYTPNSGRLTPASERALRDNFAAEWEKEGARQSALERVGTSGT